MYSLSNVLRFESIKPIANFVKLACRLTMLFRNYIGIAFERTRAFGRGSIILLNTKLKVLNDFLDLF